MSHDLLHFGAGALGRCLVLPRIVQAGGSVQVADTDAALVDHIRGQGGYRIVVAGPTGRREYDIPVAAAFAIGRDDAALDAAIAEATFVTTSVQLGNLPRVVPRLSRVWQVVPSRPRYVVGSENMRHVGKHIAGLFEQAGGLPDSVTCPDCVVDRISAALPGGFIAETEPYSEWVIETSPDVDLPGPDRADDVDRLFFRKRYLVNSLADASSFLGLAKGKIYLHEAMHDDEIQQRLAPLLDLLRAHLERVFGFDARDLLEYQRSSVSRLGNVGISRRLDTVARDPWRKFGPEERFLEPILAEAAAGFDVRPALAAFSEIVASAEPDSQRRQAKLLSVWEGSPAVPFLGSVA